jgi:hypothetical protein
LSLAVVATVWSCRIVCRPPSVQCHCRRCHCCNLLRTPTALVVPSAAHCALSSHCPPTAAIVTATPSSLRPLSLRLLPPALVVQPPARWYHPCCKRHNKK